MKNFSIPLNHKHKYPFIDRTKVKVPKEMEVPILLIRNELQNRMLYNALNSIGVYESHFEAHLDKLILASLKMWDGSDETNSLYFKLIEKNSADVSDDLDIITKRALKIYRSLVKARNSRKANVNLTKA